MKFYRPRSLNGLILLGFSLIALPLLVAVLWALFNLDRLAWQAERLVVTGVAAAENNRLLAEQLAALERLSRQHYVLGSTESLELMRLDLERLELQLAEMATLTELAGVSPMASMISAIARRIVTVLERDDIAAEEANMALGEFAGLRKRVTELTAILSAYVDDRLAELQASTQRAQRISAWQVAALLPGTLVVIAIFVLLIAKPIRQLDSAIHQLGENGISKPIAVSGPTDLERLGRQLEWLRVRLLELAQEKNRFLRHMSHELKTPLANIREGTELLLDGSVGELQPPQREVTDILRSNGLKLQRLIENLLSFSAWQSKSEVLKLIDTQLSDLVNRVVEAQRLALRAAGIHLRQEVETVTVTVDQEKLQAVLDNLLSNAIKFTPKGGVVAIRGYRLPASFVIEVADTGPGVPPEESERIYDAFFQGRLRQGGQVGGTGIGLSVVKECIEAHGGSIELLDSAEFSGAHFRIEIPQQRAAHTTKIAANA